MFALCGRLVVALPADSSAPGVRTEVEQRKSNSGMANVVAWPEVVIFDCDGVLVDSELIALGQTRRALRDAGLHLSHEQTVERFLGRRMDSIVQLAQAELGETLPREFPAHLTRDIVARFETELKGIEGVRQAVAGLRARICVASSSAPDRIRQSLALTGYGALFEPNIFSASMVARGKPHPDLFLLAAREMGVAPEQCLVIEDSIAGLQAACSAGMEAFAFVGGSHFQDRFDREPLVAAGAVLTFDDMAQLPALVEERQRRRAGNEPGPK
jgi:HAD superfamily hydrolase (TIGR01509 family)